VGLIAWGTPLADRLSGPAPGRVRGWLAESLGVSLAAQLATLPIVVLSFGRLSLVSPIVNLGVVPLVAPAMAAGALALAGGMVALAGLPAAFATVLGLAAWLLFSVMVGIVRTGAAVPFASVQLTPPWDAVAAGISGIVIVAATAWARRRAGGARTADARPAPPIAVTRRAPPSWWRSRKGRLLAASLAASVIALSVAAVHRPDGIPRVTVLDVGQGDAILVEGGRGGRLLVDGGPDPGRLLVALDEHLPPWDRRIDIVVLSHPHEDHDAGLAALLDRYVVDRVLEPGMFGPGPGYAALNAELFDRGIARGTLATGDRVAVDDILFRVLWPDPGTVPERPAESGTGINNVSIVLLGEVGRHRLLLTGDIEEEIDPRLLARGLPTVDLLKVAHHGSRTASTDAFLAALQPAIAVISTGRGNSYGHPTPEAIERLRAAGAEVFRTDEDGSVTVDLGPGPLRVHASGARTAALPTGPGTADKASWPDPPIRLGYDAQRDGPHSGRSALPAAVCEPLPPSRHLVRRRRADRSRPRHR
jgi:competence protein ComEC